MSALALLYVDDDADIRHIVELSLALDAGIAARIAASGADALAMLDDGWRPDVALIDVMMPVMDGPSLLAALHERPAFARLPVIFMTARGRPADIAAYRACGAIGTILKPFDPMRLAADVRGLIEASGPAHASIKNG